MSGYLSGCDCGGVVFFQIPRFVFGVLPIRFRDGFLGVWGFL